MEPAPAFEGWVEEVENRTKNETSQRRRGMSTEPCHRSQGRRESQEKHNIHSVRCFRHMVRKATGTDIYTYW